MLRHCRATSVVGSLCVALRRLAGNVAKLPCDSLVVSVSLSLSLFLFMNICMYVCMYVCIYIYMYVYLFLSLFPSLTPHFRMHSSLESCIAHMLNSGIDPRETFMSDPARVLVSTFPLGVSRSLLVFYSVESPANCVGGDIRLTRVFLVYRIQDCGLHHSKAVCHHLAYGNLTSVQPSPKKSQTFDLLADVCPAPLPQQEKLWCWPA